MTVLVPPAVLHEVKTILHLPVIADQLLNLPRQDRRRIQAADKETGIVRLQRSIRTEDVTIHAGKNLAAGNIQPFTDELGIVDVAPEFSYFNIGPLFSTLTSSGWSGATLEKQALAASSMSGWLSLI